MVLFGRRVFSVSVGRRGVWSPLADVGFGLRWPTCVLVSVGRCGFWSPVADVRFGIRWPTWLCFPLAGGGSGPRWPTWVLVPFGRRGFWSSLADVGFWSPLAGVGICPRWLICDSKATTNIFIDWATWKGGGSCTPPLSTLVTVGRRANGGGKMFIWTKNGSDPPHFHVGQTVKGISTPPLSTLVTVGRRAKGGGIGPLPVPRRPICENVFFNVFRITHIGPWRLAYTRSPFLGFIVNFCTTDVEWFGFGML